MGCSRGPPQARQSVSFQIQPDGLSQLSIPIGFEASTENSNQKVAPWPGPSLSTMSEAPSSPAALAELWRPKPCPSALADRTFKRSLGGPRSPNYFKSRLKILEELTVGGVFRQGSQRQGGVGDGRALLRRLSGLRGGACMSGSRAGGSHRGRARQRRDCDRRDARDDRAMHLVPGVGRTPGELAPPRFLRRGDSKQARRCARPLRSPGHARVPGSVARLALASRLARARALRRQRTGSQARPRRSG